MIRAIKPSTFRRRAAVARECSSAIGFTLVELLVVIAIIALLASTLLVSLAGAKENARVARARSQIARIYEILIERWEWYQTRPLPVRVPSVGNPAAFRLRVVRELMRMEMPDRRSDVLDLPTLNSGRGTALRQA